MSLVSGLYKICIKTHMKLQFLPFKTLFRTLNTPRFPVVILLSKIELCTTDLTSYLSPIFNTILTSYSLSCLLHVWFNTNITVHKNCWRLLIQTLLQNFKSLEDSCTRRESQCFTLQELQYSNSPRGLELQHPRERTKERFPM